jgi:ABC-type proline/glycine betaine transport system permease subunit
VTRNSHRIEGADAPSWTAPQAVLLPAVLPFLYHALFTLVITALVGARHLGQDVAIVRTKAKLETGLGAGLASALVAISADWPSSGSQSARKEHGLEGAS